MTGDEADAIIRRLRQGSRLLLGDAQSYPDHVVVEIKALPDGRFQKEEWTILADGNTPAPPPNRKDLPEPDLRCFLLTCELEAVRKGLTRVPKPADYPIEIVESGKTTRRYQRICGFCARSVEALKSNAREAGGDALLDLRTFEVANDPGVLEVNRGVHLEATVIAWLE